MTKVQDYFDAAMKDLREQREKLAALVQEDFNKTRHELLEAWQQLESRWHELKTADSALRDKASEAGQELGERIRHLIDEIRAGYHELQSGLRPKSPEGETHADSEAPTGNDASRQAMIAEAAYYRASWRGFSDGDPLEDWLSAERQIDKQLTDAHDAHPG